MTPQRLSRYPLTLDSVSFDTKLGLFRHSFRSLLTPQLLNRLPAVPGQFGKCQQGPHHVGVSARGASKFESGSTAHANTAHASLPRVRQGTQSVKRDLGIELFRSKRHLLASRYSRCYLACTAGGSRIRQRHTPTAYANGIRERHTPTAYAANGIRQRHTPTAYANGIRQRHTPTAYANVSIRAVEDKNRPI